MKGHKRRWEAWALVAVIAPILAAPLRAAEAIPAGTYDPADFPRFELAPAVQAIFSAGGQHAQSTYNYLRYANALVVGGDALDAVVADDIVLNDLQPMGFSGLAGLKEFRQQRNAAMSYDRAVLLSIEFPADDISDVDLCTERTEPTTGEKFVSVIHAKDRWVGGKVVERWHSPEPQAAGTECMDLAAVR